MIVYSVPRPASLRRETGCFSNRFDPLRMNTLCRMDSYEMHWRDRFHCTTGWPDIRYSSNDVEYEMHQFYVGDEEVSDEYVAFIANALMTNKVRFRF